MLGTGIDEPTAFWPAQAEQHEAAEAAFLLWQRQDAELPVGVGPATVLLTPFEDGEAGKASRGNGTTLKTAIEDALSRLEAPSGERLGLVLDVARAEYPKGAHVPAGDGGPGAISQWGPVSEDYMKVYPDATSIGPES